ncbi:MAG: tRNA (adenosine(37)-N6)-dimethylallyltransferase MiaA [Bacteroidales bacterium]|nr:tRNA (adenosine(37)-N6)-dimethylallyltransferase MiaA [Bacteroidales bacterium]
MGRKLLILLGPTAVGKTDYSLSLAQQYGSPIISCDSRQIYREMRIGTAVPSDAQLAAVRHYFIQTVSVKDYYTAGIYETEALALIRRLFDEGHETLVMTGGSMFYIDAVCNGLSGVPTADLGFREELRRRAEAEDPGWLARELERLDPEAYRTMDLSNRQRLFRAVEICLWTGQPYSSFKPEMPAVRDFEIEKIGLMRPREEIYARIDRRVLQMMDDGLLEEVRSLLPYRDCTALQTVGYTELFDYLDGKTSLDEAVRLIQRNTRHYAKRQLSWWRRDPSIRWIEATEAETFAGVSTPGH